MNVIDRTRELLIDLDYTLQPIVILKKDGTKQIICYELLLRSLKDMKVPLELLKLVSMSEQVNTLFLRWKRDVLRQVIKKHSGSQICINLTSQQLSYRSTWKFLADFKFVKEHILIEITEDKTPMLGKKIHTQLSALRHFGYGIVLDDIGYGQNTYELIKENITKVVSLKISLLKLTDMSLSTKLLFVRAWKAYATAHGVSLVVEGIEDANVATKVAKIGCLQQGYYWCA